MKPMQSLIATALLFITALSAHAGFNCLTNLDIYCTGNNQTSTSQNGTTTAPTNEVHGIVLLNETGSQEGTYVNFYGTCSSVDQVVAVLVYSCNNDWCGLGRCDPGAHETNITLPAGCDIISGYITFYPGSCCSVYFHQWSTHPCTPPGGDL